MLAGRRGRVRRRRGHQPGRHRARGLRRGRRRGPGHRALPDPAPPGGGRVRAAQGDGPRPLAGRHAPTAGRPSRKGCPREAGQEGPPGPVPAAAHRRSSPSAARVLGELDIDAGREVLHARGDRGHRPAPPRRRAARPRAGDLRLRRHVQRRHPGLRRRPLGDHATSGPSRTARSWTSSSTPPPCSSGTSPRRRASTPTSCGTEVRNAVIAWPDVVELNWQWVGRDVPEPVADTRGHPAGARRRRGRAGLGPRPAQRDHRRRRRRHPHRDRRPRPRSPSSRPGSSSPAAASTPRASRKAGWARPPSRRLRLRVRPAAQRAAEPASGFRPDPPADRADPAGRPAVSADARRPDRDRAAGGPDHRRGDRAGRGGQRRAGGRTPRSSRRRRTGAGPWRWPGPSSSASPCSLAFLIWRKWGEEPERRPRSTTGGRSPTTRRRWPSPCMEWGYVDTDAFSATVVDLAQRGYLTIEETEHGPHVHRDRQVAGRPARLREQGAQEALRGRPRRPARSGSPAGPRRTGPTPPTGSRRSRTR